MENEKNNILPDYEDVEDAQSAELVSLYRIKAAEQYAEKEYLLERDHVGFSPRGNVCAIAAEKKAGKTWFAMALASAATSGEYLGIKAREKELKVLYFDTEQDAGDGQRIQRRVHYANRWDFEVDNDRFQIFHLREVDASERRRVVANITTFLKADLVIVDGIRDLLADFNDLEQSAEVIQEHMRLSSALNCCIWDVLHVNPGSEKMRGHLGTELGNKVADIIFLTKHKNPKNEDDVTYKAEETDARGHKDIHSIIFRIEDSVPYGMPVLVDEEEAEQRDMDIIQQEKEDINATISKYLQSPSSMSWTKLRDSVRVGEAIGQSKAGDLVNKALDYEIVIRHSNGKLTYNGLREVKKPEELPFDRNENDKPAF